VLVDDLEHRRPVTLLAKSRPPSTAGRTLPSMLSDTDSAVLDFEGTWWTYPGPKDRAIREFLGMSATRYYQILRRLVDDAEAEAAAPLTIRRLRRVREEARRRSVERTLGGGAPSGA
jgi:hypothetical protein